MNSSATMAIDLIVRNVIYFFFFLKCQTLTDLWTNVTTDNQQWLFYCEITQIKILPIKKAWIFNQKNLREFYYDFNSKYPCKMYTTEPLYICFQYKINNLRYAYVFSCQMPVKVTRDHDNKIDILVWQTKLCLFNSANCKWR